MGGWGCAASEGGMRVCCCHAGERRKDASQGSISISCTSIPGAARKKCSEDNMLGGTLQGFSGLVMLEIEAQGQGSSGKSGCINRVKSIAPGKEDHFLQTHGVTLTLPLGLSSTTVVTRKTKVTLTVTGETHRGATGARLSLTGVSVQCPSACTYLCPLDTDVVVFTEDRNRGWWVSLDSCLPIPTALGQGSASARLVASPSGPGGLRWACWTQQQDFCPGHVPTLPKHSFLLEHLGVVGWH